jgi:hypothetical protein
MRRIHKPIRIDRPGLHVVGDIDAVIAGSTEPGESRVSHHSSTQHIEITQRRRTRTRPATDDKQITGGT